MPVLDRLDTHPPASRYAAFPAAEAERPAAKPEIHHPPRHGGWLDIAEPEPSVLQRRCLGQRFGDRAAPERAVAARAGCRTAAGSAVDRRFTTAGARTKLKRLYPTFEE